MAQLLCRIDVKNAEMLAVPPLVVNGRPHSIQFNADFALDEDVIDAAKISYPALAVLGPVEEPDEDSSPAPSGDDDDAAAGQGGAGGGVDTFNAEAVINGTVTDVAARLTGLTAEQLDAVAAAEADREQPRKGVADAIEDARKALA